MKKIKRLCLCASLSLVTMLALTSSMFANSFGFSSIVPEAQMWKEIGGASKSSSSSYGYVTVDYTKSEAVSFYAYTSNGGVGPATTVRYDQVGQARTLGFGATYGGGQYINVKLRNSNWSLNMGSIAGTIDVQ